MRVDYLSAGMRPALYTPYFFVRSVAGAHYLVETKGQVDRDVPLKANAAVAWCRAATNASAKWQYLYVPEGVFQRFQGNSIDELFRFCTPSLSDLLNQEKFREELPLFASAGMDTLEAGKEDAQRIVPEELLQVLPGRYRKAADEAIALFRYFEKKENVSYAPVFTAVLGAIDEAARGLLLSRLLEKMPVSEAEQRSWFEPYTAGIDRRMQPHYEQIARNLRKTLVYRNGVSPLGLLRNCLEYALNDNTRLTGVFEAIKETCRFAGGRKLLERIAKINDFRNTRVAHQEQPLTDRKEAEAALRDWIDGLVMFRQCQ